MRKIFAIALAVLAFGAASFAQSETKGEVFGGYQYTSFDISNEGVTAGNNRINLNGWNAAATGFFNKNFGITGDFSGAYGTPDFGGGIKVKTTLYTYMFGPTVRFGGEKVQPYVHGLFGGMHGKLGESPDEVTDSSFAMAFGGGVDVAANNNFAVRVGQFDYVYSKLGGVEKQNSFRYSAGVVFRF